MAAVIPSILVMISFILVMLVCYLSYKKRAKNIVHKEAQTEDIKLSPLRLIIANGVGISIVVIIFGGIYTGLFTPTEAGAVGAFTAFLAALFLGKVNLGFFNRALTETIKVTGMVMLILIGAQIFEGLFLYLYCLES